MPLSVYDQTAFFFSEAGEESIAVQALLDDIRRVDPLALPEQLA